MRRLDSRFDWYEMTFDTLDDDRVAPSLALALSGQLVPVKGRNGYRAAWAIERGEGVLATVYGHSARQGEVHIAVTSDACDEVVPVLRRLYADHRVSRADSAVDFQANFESLDPQVVEFAEGRGLYHMLMVNSEGGATRYVGSPRSEVRMRFYKKSEELRAKHPERAEAVPEGIVRMELVVRPGKRSVKERVAAMHPDGLWGLSGWSQEFAATVLDIDAERVSTHFRRPPEWQRALHYLGLQYGPTIQRRAEAVGFDQVAVELFEALGLLEPAGSVPSSINGGE